MTIPGDPGNGDNHDEGAAARRHMWLSDLSIRQPVLITMAMLAVMVIGGFLYRQMAVDLFPDVSVPIVAVQTVYPGATPEEVERSVTKPIEDAVASINGVDVVRSVSMDSVSQVVIDFQMDLDGKTCADEVRTRVATIRNALPEDVEEPVIGRWDPSSSPILSYAIADKSGKRPPEELRKLADDILKPRIERVSGIAAAEVNGGRVRQVNVTLSLDKLESYGVPPQQIIQAIAADNIDIPGGRLTNQQSEEMLSTKGEVRSLSELGDVPILSQPGLASVRLRDVATISEGFAESRGESRLNGKDSVVVNVFKQSGTNTVLIADAVKAEVERLEQEYTDLDFAATFDQSTFTRESVEDIQISLLLGAVLAALVVLLFFRDIRNTLVTIAGLPVIILGTMAALSVLGISLNLISMMALSLSVGMLIDDAIVVRENIFRHMERGDEPKVAASHGTAEIALAVLAVTSTIVAVFLPMAFTGGLAGKFFRDFGITVAVAVVISLIEAFTLAPMLSAYFFKRIETTNEGGGKRSILERFFQGLNIHYRRVLEWSLGHRGVIVVVSIVVFASSLLVLRALPMSFLPEADRGQFSIDIEMAPGAPLSQTDNAARVVEGVLLADSTCQYVFTTVGSSDGSVEKAKIEVKLRQNGRTDEVIQRLRPNLDQALGDIKFTIDRQSIVNELIGGTVASQAFGRPIQFSIQSDDMATLDRVSAEVVNRLKQTPGITDVDRSLKPGKPQRNITVDRAKAADLGISNAQIGAVVRALVNGQKAGVFRDGEDDLDIMVRLADADRDSVADILRIPMATSRGTQVPLSSLASLIQSSEPTRIQRENRQRQVVIGAGYQGRDSGMVTSDARAVVNSIELPPGTSISVYGVTKYTDQMFQALGLALVMAVLFVYMILASQFGSFIHPLTIMLALPFSVVGALLSLYLGNFHFDMLAMIGVILLAGLVTKNSILLVEFTNQLRRRGLNVSEAILEAGPTRLRPILMTTLAMVFGMIPVAAGIGTGSELRQSMGVSVIGGLIVSTALTLLIVPVAYSLIEDASQRLRRGRRSVEGSATHDSE